MSVPVTIEIKKADSLEEREVAKKLIASEYEKEGYVQRGQEMSISRYLDLPQTTTFVAKNNNEIIGTISVVFGDSLPMEELYAEELKKIRKSGDIIAEVCQLAIDRNLSLQERASNNILIKLFNAVLKESVRKNVDSLVIAINPKHERMYDFFGFEDFGGLKTYEAVNGAPALAKIGKLKVIIQRCGGY